MIFEFRAQLVGMLCGDCNEPLSNVIVRLYRTRAEQNVVELAVASPKETFAILDDDAIAAKKGSLLAEAKTDAHGRVAFRLDEKRDGYRGEPFEIDVYCETVPGRTAKSAPRPLQFSITTLQPKWRRTDAGAIAGWEYTVPARIWCGIRQRFDAWVICGRVLVCDTDRPVGGVKVRAFDVDWIQDDPLGEATTAADGHFRIDYTSADFTRTTISWLRWEIAGPDVYFRVLTTSDTVLLDEPPSRGRAADRQNVGPCFCASLCVSKDTGGEVPEPISAFNSVGNYNFTLGAISPVTGLTAGDSRAFFSTVRLNGILAKTLGGQALEYKFQVAPYGTSAWTDIHLSQVARTVIGQIERYAPDPTLLPFDPNPVKVQIVAVNGGGADVVPAVTGDGWIQVPQGSNAFGAEGFFQPNNNMINLDTTTLAAFATPDLTGVGAGQSADGAGHPLPQNQHFTIRMLVRPQGTSGAGTLAGTCLHLAVENSRFLNVRPHPEWGGGATLPPQPGVCMIDILQEQAAPCQLITNQLDILFTAAHPNLGSVGISMTGPNGTTVFSPPAIVSPQSAQNRFGTAVPPSGFSPAALQPCAYIVHLSVELLLTNGDGFPSPLHDEMAFCK